MRLEFGILLVRINIVLLRNKRSVFVSDFVKPMLASTCKDINSITYPVIVSPKLDGVRGMIQDNTLLSRSLKLIPNHHVQRVFGRSEFNGFDGELILGDPVDDDCFRRTTSLVMSHDKIELGIIFHVFDIIPSITPSLDNNTTFIDRYSFLKNKLYNIPKELRALIKLVPCETMNNKHELLLFEEEMIKQGYEGVMIRSMNSEYKHGRATPKSEWLQKIKRFDDAEGVIIECSPLLKNNNEVIINELGYSSRSHAKDNLESMELLGSFTIKILNGEYKNTIVSIGTGFTKEQREEYWQLRDELNGRIISFQYFSTGAKDAPRFPSFRGFRDKKDMS